MNNAYNFQNSTLAFEILCCKTNCQNFKNVTAESIIMTF